MQAQSVIDIGANIISANIQNIEGHENGKQYLIKLEKDGCKTRIFRAKTNTCGCRIDFCFTIRKCIDDAGKWKLFILEDEPNKEDRTQLFKNTITIYKS